MATNDILSNALSLMLNNEKIGRADCIIKPVSKLIKDVLAIMKQNGYVSEFAEFDDGKGKYLELRLSGAINKCGVVKPRFNAKMRDFEKFERRYLPARDMGILIISTHLGVMTHKEAKKKNVGGRLVAYCY